MDTLGPHEKEMLTWLDHVRRQAHLPPLHPLPALMAAARAKCAEVVAHGVLSHRGGAWGSPTRLQTAFGVRARVMGAENLAAYADPARAFLALMASEGHRSNILHPEHDAVGVCILPWRGIAGAVAVCQEFAGGLWR